LADAIERHGGRLVLSAPVTRIVINGGRAVGVEFESRHLGHRTVRAPVVISDADVKETMLELVGAQHLKPRTVARLHGYEMAPALGVVYLGVKRDLRAAGVPNTNFWIHPSYDQEPVYADARAGRFHPEPFCYVSIATLKDPDNRKSAPPGVANIELATVVPSQPEAWGTTPEDMIKGAYHDNPAYRRAKDAFAARLIATADRVFPGLAKDVVFQEVSSPMTHTRYTHSTGGTAYGIALIPSQSLFRRVGHATEIPGLYLCGASTYTGHGIPGVMWSGVLAASRIAGRKVLKEVMR
jgi:phytoene dehydrogenase-like protein